MARKILSPLVQEEFSKTLAYKEIKEYLNAQIEGTTLTLVSSPIDEDINKSIRLQERIHIYKLILSGL